jgi:superfamily I DNA/RNA helicase
LLSFLDHVEIELKEARGGSLWENGGGGQKHQKHQKHHTQNKKNKKNTQNTKNTKEQGVVDRSKGVYVGTAHQSKGLEWKVVFVVGMHDGESFCCVFVFFGPMYRPSD